MSKKRKLKRATPEVSAPARARDPLAWEKPYLAALREQPNLHRAARLVGRHIDTITEHRERHPDFDAAVKEALSHGTAHLEEIAWDHAENPSPPKSPATRARTRSRDWKPVFLAALKEGGIVTRAADVAQVPERTAREHKKSDPDFAEAWAEALDYAVEGLEAEARRRAVAGTLRPVYQGGKRVGLIREYSDTLLLALLKAHRPEKYRERFEHSGPGGGPVSVAVTANEELMARLRLLPEPAFEAEIARLRTLAAETRAARATEPPKE